MTKINFKIINLCRLLIPYHIIPGFKGGPSDHWTKILQEILKNHPYTAKTFKFSFIKTR